MAHKMWEDLDEALKHPSEVYYLSLYGDDLMQPDLEIPKEIGSLTHLEILELDCWGNITFPDEFSYCDKLKKLIISECRGLKKQPQLRSFPDLEEITYHGRDLDLRGCFVKLKKLRRLSFSTINEVKKELRHLRTLEELRLWGMKGRTLPKEIAHLKNLKKLNISYQPIATFSKALCTLPRLEELNISSTFIDELPLEIKNLKNLKVLKFDKPAEHHNKEKYKTRVKQIRQAWTTLENLEELYLARQHIMDVSAGVKNWTLLRILDLSFNNMDELPLELCSITSLEKLKLNHNPLTMLPDEFTQLIHLKELEIINTHFEQVPPQLFALKNLEKLDARRCQWSDDQWKLLRKKLPGVEIRDNTRST